jgi:hypothetical protein
MSPIQDNSHREMSCQPTGVSENGCSACQSGVLHSLGDILGGAKSPCPYSIF